MADPIRLVKKHAFVALTSVWKKPIPCFLCKHFIWGLLLNQGYKCQGCDMRVHNRCLNRLTIACCAVDDNSNDDKESESSSESEESRETSSLISSAESTSISFDSDKNGDGDGDDDDGDTISAKEVMKENKKIGLDDLLFIKLLGMGGFGKVVLAEEKATKQLLAVKILRKKAIVSKEDVSSVETEKRILVLSSRHPFLIGMRLSFQTDDRLFLAMDYASGGEIYFHLKKEGKFDEPRVRLYAAELTLALQFLHRHGVIHRDLKLENILLDCEGHCKLADFGLCKEAANGHVTANTFCGSPEYMAPEMLEGFEYDGSVDWWALGVVMYDMLVGQPPFYGAHQDQLFDSIVEDQVQFPDWLSKKAVSIIKGFLKKNPSERLGCAAGDNTVTAIGIANNKSAICQHLFFKKIDWSAVEARQVKPTFIPKIQNMYDTTNFDQEFTDQDVSSTIGCSTSSSSSRSTDDQQAAAVAIINDKDVFKNFSFSNLKIVDA